LETIKSRTVDKLVHRDLSSRLERLAPRVASGLSGGLTVSQMRAVARKMIHMEPKRKPIIFVDYLQIIRGDSPSYNRTEVVGQISNDLKQMAKEFDCPVVCLSQLNRGVEIRDNKRPVMSDLRDSGNIEQDADVIGFLYRDDYYNNETDMPGLLEINTAKHRNGPTGTTVKGARF
jgi:replicative DNA helicase